VRIRARLPAEPRRVRGRDEGARRVGVHQPLVRELRTAAEQKRAQARTVFGHGSQSVLDQIHGEARHMDAVADAISAVLVESERPAARLSGDAAPRACEACDGSGWGYNADGSEGAPCAACLGSGISASAPRPQEGEAAALDAAYRLLEVEGEAWARAIREHDRDVSRPGRSDALIAGYHSLARAIAARLASPLPPRDERRADVESPEEFDSLCAFDEGTPDGRLAIVREFQRHFSPSVNDPTSSLSRAVIAGFRWRAIGGP
jgi:hypothetical protein